MKNIILFFAIYLTIIKVPFAGGQAYKTIGTVHRDSPEINSLILEDAVIEVLAEGFDWSEGPV